MIDSFGASLQAVEERPRRLARTALFEVTQLTSWNWAGARILPALRHFNQRALCDAGGRRRLRFSFVAARHRATFGQRTARHCERARCELALRENARAVALNFGLHRPKLEAA